MPPQRVKGQRRLVVGMTGGIASGKTEVLKELARHGIPVISSDVLAHQCLQRGQPIYGRLIRHFGLAILNRQKGIDRETLGQIVFAHASERRFLERIVHPYVIRHLKQFIRRHHGILVLDIPLLFEVKLEHLVDFIVVVYCTRKQQIKRLIERNRYSRKEALRRINTQMPLNQKRRRADFILTNTNTLTDLRRDTARLIDHLSFLHRRRTPFLFS